MEKGKNIRGRRLFSAFLFCAWLTFMALAGFFIPSFLSDLPLLQIREITVEGNRTIDMDTVRSAIYSVEGSVFKLSEDQILSVLNERTGGRVKRVFVTKNVSIRGISIRIRIQERVPVAKVRSGSTYIFIDEEGKTFPAYDLRSGNLPEVVTHDLKVLEENFPKLYRSVKGSGIRVSLIKVLKDRTILVSGRRQIILPPIDLLPDNVVDRLRMVYNFREGKIDLRFDRFILVRN